MASCVDSGINGFVGPQLAGHLTAFGWNVFVFDMCTGDVKICSFQGEITDRSALKLAFDEVIYHLAGVIKSDMADLLSAWYDYLV
jgi:hypothetical protein